MITGRTGKDCGTCSVAEAAGITYEMARSAILDKDSVSSSDIENAISRLGVKHGYAFRLGKSFSLSWGLYGRRAILTYRVNSDEGHAVYWDGYRIHCSARPQEGGRSVIDFYEHLNGRSIDRPIVLETPFHIRIASILIGTWISAIYKLKGKQK